VGGWNGNVPNGATVFPANFQCDYFRAYAPKGITGAGAWTNSPTSYTYQWKRDGVAITGATSITYTPVAADVGHQLTITVIASNAAGSSAPATSAPTAAIIGSAPEIMVTWNGAGSNAFTWDASITFPGDGRTMLADDGSAYPGARAIAAPELSGKAYYEIKFDQRTAGTDLQIGLEDTTLPNADMSYYFANGLLWQSNDGAVATALGRNYTQVATIPYPTTGQSACFAVDRPNRKIWMRINNGPWNGDASADPATGAGGWVTDATVTHFAPHAAFFSGSITDSITLNTTASSLSYAAPSGFAAAGGG
jgi:hypothetical protein